METIHNINIAEEMAISYTTFALSTLGRALPSAEDGLKLSQRRLVQSGFDVCANQLVKLTRVAGHCMALYHPHADASGVVVGMANGADYANPLFEIQGNAGGWARRSRARISNDNAASSRYLETKLSEFAKFCFDIDEYLLEGRANYDGRETEIVKYAPALPILALQGANGISTGYACNHAPYNLSEVCNVLIASLSKGADLVSLASKLVPDFGNDIDLLIDADVSRSVETGNGTLRLRGRWATSKEGRNRDIITISTLPFASAETFCHKVKAGVESGKITSIADCRDLSNADGICIELLVKKACSVEQAKAEIIAHTPFSDTFSINATALFGKSLLPEQKGLGDLLTAWLEYRLGIIEAKRLAELGKAKLNLANQSALLEFLANPKQNVLSIAEAEDEQEAIALLMQSLSINKTQAEYIISISLRKLLKTEVSAQADIVSSLLAQVASLETQDNKKVIIGQLKYAIRHFGKERGTKPVHSWVGYALQAQPQATKPITTLDLLIEQGKALNPPIGTRRVKQIVAQALDLGQNPQEAFARACAKHKAYWSDKGKSNDFKLTKEQSIALCKKAGVKPMSQKQMEREISRLEDATMEHIRYWSSRGT